MKNSIKLSRRTLVQNASLAAAAGMLGFASSDSTHSQDARPPTNSSEARDRAVLICAALAPTPVDRRRARIDGQEISVSRSIAFATTVIDLMKPMEMWAAGPFDYLHYYLLRDFLGRVAMDNKIVPIDSFSDVVGGRCCGGVLRLWFFSIST